MVLLAVVDVVVIGCWTLWWLCGDGCGGASLCEGGSCNSGISTIVKCILCGEGGGEVVVVVGGDGGGIGGGGGQDKSTTTTFNTTINTNTTNTTTKHINT